MSDKVKLTLYLTPETADALDDAWHAMRRRVPAAERGGVSKSAVAELALEKGLSTLAPHSSPDQQQP